MMAGEAQTGSAARAAADDHSTAQFRYRVRTRPQANPVPAVEPVIDDSSADSDAYEVGYGKPPKNNRFKPGQSGNSKGRPKGTRNLKTDLAEELQERISLKEGGKTKQVSKQRALVKSLMAKALQGDARAAALLLAMVTKLLDQAEVADRGGDALSPEDLEILKNYDARLLRRAAQKQENDHAG
jgi:hypothetical protein